MTLKPLSQDKLTRPCSLACSHSYCEKCIFNWCKESADVSTIEEQNRVAEILRQSALAVLDGDVGDLLEWATNFSRQFTVAVCQKSFTCPQCRAPMKSAPLKSVVMTEISRIVGNEEVDGDENPAWDRWFKQN